MATAVIEPFRPGRVANIHKFGRNADVDSGANEDIIEQGGLMAYDSGGALYEILSSSGDDTSKSGWFEGVNSSYEWVREKFTTNGTTPVALTTSWYSVFRGRLDDTCAGQITCRTATGDNTRAIILAGYGGTNIGAITVPLNYQMELHFVKVEFAHDSSNAILGWVQLLDRTIGGPWNVRETLEFSTHVGASTVTYDCPRIIPAGHDVKLHVEEMSANDIRVSGDLGLELVNIRHEYQEAGPTLVGF